VQYFLRARDEAIAQLATALIRGLAAELGGVLEQLVQLGRELEQLASSLARPIDDNSLLPSDSTLNVRPLVADSWRKRRSELAVLVQQQIRREFLEPAGGLYDILTKGRSQELVSRLREAARLVVLDALRSVDLMGFLLADSNQDKPEPTRLQSVVDAATPKFISAGGAKHLVAILPGGPDAGNRANEVRQAINSSASVLVTNDNEITMCCEGTALSLAHIAVNLIQGRRDYLELAERVHTRHDVDWSPLAGLAPVIVPADTNIGQIGNRAGPATPAWNLQNQESINPEPSVNAL
jgi:hypothetical protein